MKIDKIVNNVVTVGVPIATYTVLLLATGGKGANHLSPVIKTMGLGNMKYAIPVSVCGGFVFGKTSELLVDAGLYMTVLSEYKAGTSKEDLKAIIDTYNVSEDLKASLKRSVDNFKEIEVCAQA